MAVPVAAVAVGLVVMLIFTVQNAAAKIEDDQYTLESTQNRLEQRQAQKKELVESIAVTEKKLTSMKVERNNYSAALESMNNKANLVNGDLKAIVDNAVTDLELYEINNTGTQLALFGQAATEQEVMNYVRKLQDTGRFTEITISSLTRTIVSDNSTDVMRYSLAFKLKKG